MNRPSIERELGHKIPKNFVFRRVRGRIVPIRMTPAKEKERGMTKTGLATSAAIGGFVGDSVGERMGYKASAKDGLRASLLTFGDKASVKDLIAKSGVKGVVGVSGFQEAIQHEGLHPKLRQKGFWDGLFDNAGFTTAHKVKTGPKGFILSGSDQMNRSIIAHELGHAIDYQKNPLRARFQNSLVALGGQYAMEKRAWNLAPLGYDPEVRKAALGTYKTMRNYKMAGLAVGAGIASAAYALWNMRKKKD